MKPDYLTGLVLISLKRNGHLIKFKGVNNIDDVKRIYKQVYFGKQEMSTRDIKGAKLINFQAMYEYFKTL